MKRKRRSSVPSVSPHLELSESQSSSISGVWKVALSVLVILQLLAVVAEPFRFFTRSTRGTSPAADPIRSVLAPYVEFMYLSHGYFFFAPEPGPSHLIDCSLTLSDGRKASIRFPDKVAQRPRLLYHRHFMLTENLHQLWVEPIDRSVISDAELSREDQLLFQQWQTERQRYETIRDSMRNHIAKRYGAEKVELDRVEHRLPSDIEVFDQRMRLNDRRLYLTLPDAPIATVQMDTAPTSTAPSSLGDVPTPNAMPDPEALPSSDEASTQQLEGRGDAKSTNSEASTGSVEFRGATQR